MKRKNNVDKIISYGDLDTILALNGSNLLNSEQQRLVTRILRHCGLMLPKDRGPSSKTLMATFVGSHVVLLGILLVISVMLSSCADTDQVIIDREPDTINNTYVTNNITEEYLTEITQVVQAEGLTITDLIQPCGNSGSHAELILRLSNGQFLAYFTTSGSALDARLTVLEEGTTYTTTDQYRNQCRFKIFNGQIEEL